MGVALVGCGNVENLWAGVMLCTRAGYLPALVLLLDLSHIQATTPPMTPHIIQAMRRAVPWRSRISISRKTIRASPSPPSFLKRSIACSPRFAFLSTFRRCARLVLPRLFCAAVSCFLYIITSSLGGCNLFFGSVEGAVILAGRKNPLRFSLSRSGFLFSIN